MHLCLAVRDALAEARGCVRVILRVRPLLPVDLRPTTSLGLELAWLFDYLQHTLLRGYRPEQVHAAVAMVARWVGWLGCPRELLRLLAGSDVSGGSSSARRGMPALASASSLDVAPTCLIGGELADASKQVVLAPQTLTLADVEVALSSQTARTSASAGGGRPPSFHEAAASLLRSRLSSHAECHHFDRVYGPEATQTDLFEGETRGVSLFGLGSC